MPVISSKNITLANQPPYTGEWRGWQTGEAGFICKCACAHYSLHSCLLIHRPLLGTLSAVLALYKVCFGKHKLFNEGNNGLSIYIRRTVTFSNDNVSTYDSETV